MKTFVKYMLVLAAGLMVLSCARELNPVQAPETDGAAGIRLALRCTPPETRSAGEAAYNENKLDHIDYFIYQSNTDDATPVCSGRLTVSSDGTVNKISMVPYVAAGAESYSGFVYVVANYPSEIDHENTAYTPADLKALEVTSAFSTLGTDGKFKAQDNFVMVSSMAPFTLTSAAKEATVTMDLVRLASKLSLIFKIQNAIDETTIENTTQTEQYQRTWYPDFTNVQVYPSYLNSHGTLAKTAEGYSDETFFTYKRYAFNYTTSASTIVKNEIVRDETTGVIVLDESDNASYQDNSYEATLFTGSPFYSYPMTWNVSDTHAPFFKIIVPMQAYKETATYYTQEHLIKSVTRTKATKDTDYPDPQEYYYKINLPISDYELTSNTWYKISIDIAALGSLTDDGALELAGQFYVVDWSDPEEEMGGGINAGLFLSANKTFDMYGDGPMTIPVIASGAIEVKAYGSNTGNPTGTYPLGTSNNTGSLTYSTTSSTGTNFMVTANGSSSVSVSHTIVPFSTSFTTANAKDIAKITYRFRIKLVGHDEPYVDVTVKQYPSLYVARQLSGGYVFINGQTGTSDNNDESLGSKTSGSQTGYFTIVSASVLDGIAETYPNWIIGDPRKPLQELYQGTGDSRYYTIPDNNNVGNWDRNDLGTSTDYLDAYLVADYANSNVIAPKLMLASENGKNESSRSTGTWQAMTKRCAAYQEYGYPAGRWRLPTDAEALFCNFLAEKTLITDPFGGPRGYWTSSGKFVKDGTLNTQASNSGNHSVRCVYDLWYWGDDPVQEGATSWLGYHLTK